MPQFAPNVAAKARRAGLAAGVLAGAIGFVLALPVHAPAQGASPSGVRHVPDFSGIWGRSDADADFQPPASRQGGLRDDPNHPHSGHQNGQAAPFVADLPNPLLQPWAEKVLEHNRNVQLAGEEMLPAHSLCWPSGVPGALRLRENVEFLQGPNDITIVYQRDHQVRHIALGVEHAQNLRPSWYGESIGHYEGDTLVVDTVGMNDKTTVDWYLTPHTDAIHTIERYRVLPDGRTLEVAFTVEDPKTFTAPWSGIVHYRRGQGTFEEIVCAENNRNVSTGKDFPIPVSAKADF